MPYEYRKVSDIETKILTHCNDCVFAQWTDMKQTGCRLGRLEKFAERGVQIEDRDMDGGQYKCVTRLCLGFRTSQWVDLYKHKDLVQQVKQEIGLKADFIIPFCEEDNLDSLSNTIRSLAEQTRQPYNIHVPNNQKKIRVSHLMSVVREASGSIPWKVTYIKDVPISVEKCIDEVYPHVTGSLYVVTPCGFTFPKESVARLDSYLNEELHAFSLLKSKVPGLYVASTQLHKHPMIEGNTQIVMRGETEEVTLNNFIEKVEWLARDHPNMIGDLDEICKLPV